MEGTRPKVYIPFELLPEGKTWVNGRNYRLKMVLRQSSSDEYGATFEIVDATSLEPIDSEVRTTITSDGGYMKMK